MNSLVIDELISDFSRFYILTILYEGPAHGYSILTKFRKRLNRNITPSIVYPFLYLLEEKGYVEHTEKPIGKKPRKIYKLTKVGEDLCRQLFKRFSGLVATAIEPSLNICANCGCKIYEGGYIETISNKETMFCCKHCANSYKQQISNSKL